MILKRKIFIPIIVIVLDCVILEGWQNWLESVADLEQAIGEEPRPLSENAEIGPEAGLSSLA